MPDDLQVQLRRYYARFRMTVLLAVILVTTAVLVAFYLMRQSEQSVLDEATTGIALKEQGMHDKLAVWCRHVESLANNIVNGSTVQLSASYYTDLDEEQRRAFVEGRSTKEDDRELVTYLRDMFATFAQSHGIVGATVVMKDGGILLGAADDKKNQPSWRQLMRRVEQEKAFQYGYMRAVEDRVMVDVAVPIFPPAAAGDERAVLGILLMSVPLGENFVELLTPPADNRGIQQMAFVQYMKGEEEIRRLTLVLQEKSFLLREQDLPAGSLEPPVQVLFEEQQPLEKEKYVYTMYFPSGEKLQGYICAVIPSDYIQRAMESKKYTIIITLCVVIIFICLLVMVISLIKDNYVRSAVNKRISEQKAILDSINASIQDGMILLSTKGNILYMNSHYFTAGGRIQWANTPLEKSLPAEAAEQVIACMHDVLKSGEEGSTELVLGDDEAKRLYRVTLYPSRQGTELAAGQQMGCVAFFRDITEFRNRARESQNRVQKILNVFSTVVESVDMGLRGHTEKMLAIIDTLSALLQFSKEEYDTLAISSRLFQVGKLFVPRHLLNKRGKLTPEEYAQVCKAPEAAYELLYSLNFGLPVAETVYEMGERMDGRGPRGLKGEEILFTARVLSVVNAFCSMVSPRTYRAAMTIEEALEQLRKDPGFDQSIVECMCTISVKDFQTILRKCSGENDSYNNAVALWDNVDHPGEEEEKPAGAGQAQQA